jgi:hypothetical protein
MREAGYIIELINTAFYDKELPSLTDIYMDESSRKEHSELLGKVSWREVSLEKVVHRDDIIVSLSAEGFTYYLPAFLHFMVMEYSNADMLGSTVIHRLTPPLSKMNVPRPSWLEDIYESFSELQKECIKNTLYYFWERYDDGLADEALESFWFDNPEVEI